MNILLHICCAPCSLYTIDKLRQDGHKVQGFFYNPNIYPLSEYKLRRQAVVDMAKRLSIKVTYNDICQQPQRLGVTQKRQKFPSEEFLAPILRSLFFAAACNIRRLKIPARSRKIGFAPPPAFAVDKQQRCFNCWRMRLCEASKMAKQVGVGAFSTTLLISPYQDHEQVRIIGSELGKKAKVGFYYDDFRIGFRQSQAMAKEAGFYRQKYCGCEYSIEESRIGSNPVR